MRARGYDIAFGSLSINYHDGQPEWKFVAVAHGRRTGAPFARLASELPQFEGIDSFRLAPARN